MADSISCPHCRRLLQVPEGYGGGEVCCPECQKVFVGGTQSGITAQTPAPMVPPATTEVQRGLPRGAGAAPWPAIADDDEDARDRLVSGRVFRPGGSLALAVKVLLGLNVVLSLALLGSYFLQYN